MPTELFDRYTAVQVSNKVFDLDTFDIEFKVTGAITTGSTPKSATAEVRIYNLAPASVEMMKTGAVVTIDAGYRSAHGLLFYGTISTVMQEPDAGDVATILTLLDALDDLGTLPAVGGTYATGTLLDNIALDMLKIGKIPVARFESSGVKLDAPMTISNNNPRQAITEVLTRINGSKQRTDGDKAKQWGLHLVNGRAYWVPDDYHESMSYMLNSQSGLVSVTKADSADKTKKGALKIEMMLNYALHPGSLIQLDSTGKSGWYQVVAVDHRASKPDYYTTIEVAAVS